MDDYVSIIDGIRADAEEHPPSEEWVTLTVTGLSVTFPVLIEGNA